jgi:hypothetical protein
VKCHQPYHARMIQHLQINFERLYIIMLDLLLEKVDFVQHIFDVFPDGVAWNILKFCEHPVARIYKDNIREIHYTNNYDMFAIMINKCPLILLSEITSNMNIIILDNTIRYNDDNIIVFNDVSEYLFYINYI